MGGPNKICETCGQKRAHYGLTDVGKRRWCAGCANEQPGETELIGANMCEDCGCKVAALPAAAVRRRHG